METAYPIVETPDRFCIERVASNKYLGVLLDEKSPLMRTLITYWKSSGLNCFFLASEKCFLFKARKTSDPSLFILLLDYDDVIYLHANL